MTQKKYAHRKINSPVLIPNYNSVGNVTLATSAASYENVVYQLITLILAVICLEIWNEFMSVPNSRDFCILSQVIHYEPASFFCWNISDKKQSVEIRNVKIWFHSVTGSSDFNIAFKTTYQIANRHFVIDDRSHQSLLDT